MGELIFQSIDGRTSVTDILDHSQIVLPDRGTGGEFRVCLAEELEKGIWCCDNLSLNGCDLVSVKWAGVDTSWSLPKVWVLAHRL